MISVLLADDDIHKVDNVKAVLSKFIAEDNLRVDCARSGHSATTFLKDHHYDLLIIDLNLPMRDSETPIADGGLKLMAEIHKKGSYNRPDHIVGLTAHENLLDSQKEAFDKKLWHLIVFRADSNEWATALGEKLVHIAEAHSPRVDVGFDFDLGIITALHQIELEMVLKVGTGWKDKQCVGDDTIYHIGTFERSGKSMSVVAAAASEMGMSATSTLAANMIQGFRPKYLVMAGIAAGVKGNFGDVLIADQSWDYGSGKIRRTKNKVKSIFLPAPSSIPISPALKAKVNLFCLDQTKIQKCKEGWLGKESQSFLNVHIGPVASGSAVIQDKEVIDELVSRNRKLIGIEMETYGLYIAAATLRGPRPIAMSAKSICDFGDSEKNDDYQKYAAYTSAKFIYEFALDQLK